MRGQKKENDTFEHRIVDATSQKNGGDFLLFFWVFLTFFVDITYYV